MVIHYVQLLANVAYLVFCACATVSVTSVGGARVNMTTSLGIVTGSVVPGDAGEHDVNVFHGIPFAKPPVGSLRFKPPQTADSWSGTKDATMKPNSCMQTEDTTFGNFSGSQMWNPNTPISEDCLYLNAWVPANSTPKAILVWIFGGGFWSGTATLDVYDAIKMAARHDVIVVSIAYRIGAFGFLYSGTDEAPGNVGMLDQVMALTWVKENAQNMGGDPRKITLFGESAGGASIGYHLLSPLSRDLFNNGIMMSASPLVNWGVQSRQSSLKRLSSLAKSVGCLNSTTSEMVSCMRGVDASVLVVEQWNVVNAVYLDTPFGLVANDSFLPRHPEVMVKNGMIKEADIIGGVVNNEGIYWLLYGFAGPFRRSEVNPVNRTQFLSVVDGILAQYFLGNEEKRGYDPVSGHPVDDVKEGDGDDDDDDEGDDADKSRDLARVIRYLATVEYHDGVAPLERMDYLHALDAMSGDVLFKCPVRDFCSAHASKRKGKVYLYRFDHQLSNNAWPSWFGTAHGYEIELVMGHPFLRPDEYTDDERALSDRTMQFFTNFAKNSDPNQGSQSAISSTTWPEFTSDSERYHVFRVNDSNADGLSFSQCKFWSQEVSLIQRHEEASLEAFGNRFQLLDKACPDGADTLNMATFPSLIAVLIGVIGVQLWILAP